MLIIDRFEGDGEDEYAVVEKTESGEFIDMIEIKRSLLPDDANEVHVLIEIDGEYKIDYEETEKRIKMISELSKGIWVKPDPSKFNFNKNIYKKK